mmetsp:Transcript_43660/g.92762  ORF Transcript_43660/g.92762 Transcript_43660/m.92762 type:complete len:135 (-) Transcript_43660:240-644(-)
MVICIPFYQRLVHMRTIPVRKRFIKEFETKDGKNVEVRLLTRLQAKVHWMPEIYQGFGKDYGRSILERDCTLDIGQVVSQYSFAELTRGSADRLDEITDDLKARLMDTCHVNKVKMSVEDTTIVFVDPDAEPED